jgi:hypothetical protein
VSFPRSLVWAILGMVLTLTGLVFFFQGIGVLPGSFMTGQIEWAIYGAVSVFAGLALLVFSRRRRV